MLKWICVAGIFTLLTACSSSQTPPADPTATPFPAEMPDDFQLIYDWATGSLPPPYYYRYTIIIGPGTSATITFTADYPSQDNPPPTWIDTFEVTTFDLESLYAALYTAGVFTGTWVQTEDPPVGGSIDDLEITAHGAHFKIPAFVEDEAQARAVRAVYKQIESRVPQPTWDRLYTLHDAYVQEHEGD